MNLQRFSVAICLFVFATTLIAQTSDDCAKLQADKGYPSYYCDCKEGYTDFILPIDTIVDGEPIWYKGWVSDLYDGVSAYMHSDCDFNFEVYTSCSAQTPKYSALFAQNQANSIDGEAIKRKLQENNVGDIDMAFYIRISPIAGNGGRLIMRKQNDGMPSSCDDPLYIFPGMSLYTTRPNDVYVVDPNQLYDLTDIILQWEPDTNTPCQLQITQATCDGPTIAQTTLHADDIYILPAQQIKQAKDNNQQLYFHLNHAANTSGMFHCLAPEYEEYYIDTLMCQGMGLQVGDTLLTEATVYTIDTVYEYANLYTIYFYDLSFYEPDLQYDTLAFQYTHQPYLYRGQYTISEPGNYDLTIHTPGQCDERYLLHVYHDRDTIVSVADTLLCYGSSFKYQGKLYSQDVSFGQAVWKNQDTLLIDSLHVRFASTPEIVHDTIMQNQNKYGKTYKQPGEFRFTYTNPNTYCVDSIILLVKPNSDVNIQYDYYYIDTTLCQGMEYEDYYGNVYTESTVLYDTIPRVMNKHYEVEITTITFTEPEIQYDTISLKTTQLPYKYNKYCIVDTFDLYDYTVHVDGRCDERYQLLVLHDIDTTYQAVDTTLCQGMVYLHNGVEYTTATTFMDSTWVNVDTFALTTVSVTFLAPETQNDTLSLRSTDLPYTYRNQHTITTYGDYDLTIHVDGECDERYLLHVSHAIDTLTQSLDTTLCQGKTYLYNGVEYTTDTTLIDTLQLDADTHQILTIQVSFLVPDIQPDTISLKTTDLPYTYREQYMVETFGEHDVLIHTPGACDERYQLLVLHDIDTLTQSLDTTLCQGKTYLYNGVEYSSDMTLVDTLQLDADTYQILTIQVAFTAPDIQLDTISLKTADLPYTYREQYMVDNFGEYDVLIHTPGACDERYQLLVLHDIDTLTQSLDTTLCQGKTYLYNGVEYSSDMTLVDTLQLDADTYQILTIQVAFTAPDIQLDTISLKTADLPYTYREQYIVEDFGEHDVLIHNPGSCDERYQLQVLHDIDTLVLEADTFLCYGNTFVYEEQEYQTDTLLQTISWLNADTMQIDILSVSFATQPIELYDTLLLASTDLPYEYRDTLLAAFGEYELLIYNHEGCLELIYLSVQEKTPTSLDDTPIYDRPRLILRDGVVYVLRGTEVFTLLGERL